MKRICLLVLLGCAAIFMTAETCVAQAQAMKIGVVDMQKFQKRSKGFQSLSAKLSKYILCRISGQTGLPLCCLLMIQPPSAGQF